MLSVPFQEEENRFEQRKRLISAFITLLIHALIVLYLLFSILRTPIPPFADNDGGITVNFGTSPVGEGDEQQYTLTPIAADFRPTPQPTAAPIQKSEEEIVTQDLEDAPEIAPPKNTSRPTPQRTPPTPSRPQPERTSTTSTTPAAPAPSQQQLDANALFSPGAYGTPNNSKGDGTGGGQGDQGSPDGDPNSRNYMGGGRGDGSGTGVGDGTGDRNVRLTGRKLRFKPEVRETSQSQGKVVIAIDVDRSGNVSNARFQQAGSTTTDQGLVNTAIEAALKYKFDAKTDAPEKQIGSIVFIFKVN